MKSSTKSILFAGLLACALLSRPALGQGKVNDLTGPVNQFSVVLTQGTNMAAAPSPTGSQIVIAVQGSLYVIPVSGGKGKLISTFDMEATHPAWSPDGSKLAFISDRTDKRQIYLSSPQGGEAAALTSFEDGVGSFAWSRDGKTLAVTRGTSGSDVIVMSNFE